MIHHQGISQAGQQDLAQDTFVTQLKTHPAGWDHVTLLSVPCRICSKDKLRAVCRHSSSK